jgi:hypothetical protein
VDFCLAFRFYDLAKIGHIMAMATMVKAISSQIFDGFGRYLANQWMGVLAKRLVFFIFFLVHYKNFYGGRTPWSLTVVIDGR